MNKLMVGSIAIAMFLIAGCGAGGPKLAASAEDIVGTWKTTETDYLSSVPEWQFNADGTYVLTTPNFVARGEHRFEGTRLIMKETGPCTTPAGQVEGTLGTYEVQLLENGNLKFTAIEDDECAGRAAILQGQTIAAEWEPVP